MTDWLEAAWDWKGMEQMKAEGDDAKEEFKLYKLLCGVYSKPPPPKKRKGKKGKGRK